MEHILCANYLLSEWEPEVIERIWSNFVPDKVRYRYCNDIFQILI